VTEDPTNRGALLDHLLTHKEGLTGDVKVKGSLDCSVHKIVEFRLMRGGNRVKCETTALEFNRADFALFMGLLERVPWYQGLEAREVEET